MHLPGGTRTNVPSSRRLSSAPSRRRRDPRHAPDLPGHAPSLRRLLPAKPPVPGVSEAATACQGRLRDARDVRTPSPATLHGPARPSPDAASRRRRRGPRGAWRGRRRRDRLVPLVLDVVLVVRVAGGGLALQLEQAVVEDRGDEAADRGGEGRGEGAEDDAEDRAAGDRLGDAGEDEAGDRGDQGGDDDGAEDGPAVAADELAGAAEGGDRAPSSRSRSRAR